MHHTFRRCLHEHQVRQLTPFLNQSIDLEHWDPAETAHEPDGMMGRYPSSHRVACNMLTEYN